MMQNTFFLNARFCFHLPPNISQLTKQPINLKFLVFIIVILLLSAIGKTEEQNRQWSIVRMYPRLQLKKSLKTDFQDLIHTNKQWRIGIKNRISFTLKPKKGDGEWREVYSYLKEKWDKLIALNHIHFFAALIEVNRETSFQAGSE